MCSKRWILLLFVATLLQITLAHAADSAASPMFSNPWDVNVTLRIQVFLPTPRPVQDAYVMLNNTMPNLVYRIERDQAKDPAIQAKKVYATTNATSHDVYKLTPNALGPFPKGKALGFTLDCG
jgi:hypothetical protein